MKLLTTLLALVLFSTASSANLLIYPVRVSFDNNERSEQVTLTNTSNQTITYRLQWKESLALPEGGYKPMSKEEAESFATASGMLRYSPRQVTLKPGERQVIKLSLRRPRNLVPGEYRSHLLFKALPPSQGVEDSKGMGMRINMVLNFSIPVTVQQGEYNAKVDFESARINLATDTPKVTVQMRRSGLHSTSGDLSAYWTPVNGKEVLIAKRSDFNFWSELDTVKAELVWAGESIAPSDGTLRVEYEGVRDFKGNTYVDRTIKVKRNELISPQ